MEPLCRTPFRNNLPIELKSSLPIGSANRQSTLHVEAWVAPWDDDVTRRRGYTWNLLPRGSLNKHRERTNRKQLGGLGLDQIFTINGLPSPGPKIGCKIPVLLQVGSPRLAGPSRGVPISRKWRVQKPSRRGRFYLDWQISLADQNRMQSPLSFNRAFERPTLHFQLSLDRLLSGCWCCCYYA